MRVVLYVALLTAAVSNAAASDDCALRIMCVGDSITWGGPGNQGGYRRRLRARLNAAADAGDAREVDLVGSGNSKGRMSAGHGSTIKNMAHYISGDVTAQDPHVVTLLAGTNDVLLRKPAAGTLEAVRGLLRTAAAAQPPPRIVLLCTVPPGRLEATGVAEPQAPLPRGQGSNLPRHIGLFAGGAVNAEFLEQAKEKLEAVGIGIPFPQRVVHLVQQ